MSDRLPVARVLFVCTANECRSPFAAAIATRAAATLPVEFDSAGLDAWRRPVPPVGLAHARELGLDVKAHVSRRVHIDGLWDYDLVLGLSRVHIRELLSVEPELRSRLFTLKQFARWIPDHPRPKASRLGPWLDREARRPGTDFLGDSADDDIADPVGQPIDDWRVMSNDLTHAIQAIIDGLFPGGATIRNGQ